MSVSNAGGRERPPMRVRITSGPRSETIGSIGYLFEFSVDGSSEESYILTVHAGRVHHLKVRDGYTYEREEV